MEALFCQIATNNLVYLVQGYWLVTTNQLH